MDRFTTPFDATSTASDVLHGVDLSGTHALVTGGAAGLGLETTRALLLAGAAVTVAVRDPERSEPALATLRDAAPGAQLAVAQFDLADRASIARLVASWHRPLNILVANAGVMATPLLRTPEGWELQFATNHLGHFELVTGLRGALIDGAARLGRAARVVSLSSAGHHRAGIEFEDLMFRDRPYDPWVAYAQAKTATSLFAVALDARWQADGIRANAVHPGGILTDLSRHLSDEQARAIGIIDEHGAPGTGFKSPQQGAATSALLAGSPLVESVGGRYFEDCNEAEPASSDRPFVGVQPWALDTESAEHLWNVSANLTNQ